MPRALALARRLARGLSQVVIGPARQLQGTADFSQDGLVKGRRDRSLLRVAIMWCVPWLRRCGSGEVW